MPSPYEHRSSVLENFSEESRKSRQVVQDLMRELRKERGECCCPVCWER